MSTRRRHRTSVANGHVAEYDGAATEPAVVADCVLLVVAADEGLLAQSYDVIQWAKEMNLNLLVALNKIDICTFEKISFVKQQLLSAGIGLFFYIFLMR